MFEKRKESQDQTPTVEQPTPVPQPADHFSSRSTAVIGQTIKIKGTVSGDENLIIEGTVDGSVDLPKHDLTVGATGKLTADLAAKNVKIDGQVTGDIAGTEKVIVSKTGHVRGNIVAPRVTLEDGAKFKGSIDMDPNESSVRNTVPVKGQPKASPPLNEAKQEAS